jgi:hypothetical protein
MLPSADADNQFVGCNFCIASLSALKAASTTVRTYIHPMYYIIGYQNKLGTGHEVYARFTH